jgi:Membrane glycosyltransferase
MLFHTQFVTGALSGMAVNWKSPPREDSRTSWGEAIVRHGPGSVLGSLWAGGVYYVNPQFLWWLAPVVGALILAVPLSVWSSLTGPGRLLRRMGMFLIPEEDQPPAELRSLRAALANTPPPPGFIEGILDPGSVPCSASPTTRAPSCRPPMSRSAAGA